MVIKVYLSMISCSQEVKKNQQRAVMILESKNIPFTTIDITDPGQEDSKEYMNENAKPKGSNRVPMTPQIFNEAEYCGDFDDLDMANENDMLGEFLQLNEEEKKKIKIGITGILPEDRARAEQQQQMTNGVSAASREQNADQEGETDTQPEAVQDAEVVNAMVDGPEGVVEVEFGGEAAAVEEVRDAGEGGEEGGEEAGGMVWPEEEQDPFAAPVEGNSAKVQMETEA